MSDAPVLLKVDQLRVEYNRGHGVRLRAVRDVDLEIFEGETLALVGESACGKSTLGRALIGLEKARSGSVIFDGHNLAGLRRRRLRPFRAELQMVFQDPYSSLNPRCRVADIVAGPLRYARGLSRRDARVRALEALEQVGLEGVADRRPSEFSGGQRQRIAIARALAPSPRFVVADEPVSGLDVSVQAHVLNLLARLAREHTLTILFISHDLGVVRHIADRVALMYLGEIVEICDRDSFFSGPAHPYGQALLSAVPVVEQVRSRERIVLQAEPPDPTQPPSGCVFRTRCLHAQERCELEAPQLRELAPGRVVRCHFPQGSEVLRSPDGSAAQRLS